MEERDWQILQVLYQKKNITKTAAELYISQPTLTGRLQQIEEKFGVQIVTRTKKGVSFTPEGKYLAERAQKILLEIHETYETIQVMKHEVKGTLRIGASNYFAKRKLPTLLERFKDQYQNIEFKVLTDFSKQVVEMVSNNEVDIGFIRGEHDWPYDKFFLFEEDIYIVSAKPISIEQLPELPQIRYVNINMVTDLTDKWWKDNFSKAPNVLMEVNRIDSCKEMIAEGLGYAFLPEGTFKDNDNLYTLKMFDKAGHSLVRRAWMIYYGERLKISSIREFIGYVKEAYANK